ncbi:helix-turn-helix domain-containing protein [Nesterenkonia sphaerica]|uniref:Helix-turn-helix domain-containing protein n=2 Tax=Nesterenkonia TaxID=57494 RepID=A0A5R9A710_9MICC|nr:helix-turn-helix domain-containing protein [Nesterenkonia sphaerica]
MSTATMETKTEATPTMPKLWTRQEAADYLGVSAKTLANWASNGIGPPYLSLCGGSVRYDPETLSAWLQDQLQSTHG